MKLDKIVDVPEKFRFVDHFPYPEDNIFDFEYWLSTAIKENDITGERCYLPITWTAFYKLYSYGQDVNAITGLQGYLQSLPRDKKYFSVCQYDSGILNNLSDLDIKVFSMAGKPMDYPLPLICQPHKFTFTKTQRTFTACFAGSMTHPVRREIIDLYYGTSKHNFLIHNPNSGKLPLEVYCKFLASSIFSLCPMGFSGNSFRVQESCQYGSIPVVISNDFHNPHNHPFEEYGIRIDLEDVKNIPEILNSYSKRDIEKLQSMGELIYRELFTFEANKNIILKKVNSIW